PVLCSCLLALTLAAPLPSDDAIANTAAHHRMPSQAEIQAAIRAELRQINVPEVAIDEFVALNLNSYDSEQHAKFVQWIKKWNVKEFAHFAQADEAISNLQATLAARLPQLMSRLYTVSLVVGNAFYDGQITHTEVSQIKGIMQILSPSETRIFNEAAALVAQEIGEEQSRILANQLQKRSDAQPVKPEITKVGEVVNPLVETVATAQEDREAGKPAIPSKH
ncbi:hypothetical protein PFISCL1PPCAC_22057, partial [Pristionchus fissidentatus]